MNNTQPLHSLPRVQSNEPYVDLIPELAEVLEALRQFRVLESAGYPVHGMAVCREYFRDMFGRQK